ncbi:hypothetical protein Mpsy_0265 [Methanolobus psychrophilus R15]|nr:hypothetical protein Mpsy_0265 [Methanolobus psychrophilus R15]
MDHSSQISDIDSLTSFDIRQFMKVCQVHEIEPRKIYRYIEMGNACSWGSYKTACGRYEKYKSGARKP